MSANKESMENLKKRKFFNPDNNILKNGYTTRVSSGYIEVITNLIKDGILKKNIGQILDKKENLLTHYKEHMEKINQLNSEPNTISTSTSLRLDG